MSIALYWTRRRAQPRYTRQLDTAQTIAARLERQERRAQRRAALGFALLRLKADIIRHRRALITHTAIAVAAAVLTLYVCAQPVMDAAR